MALYNNGYPATYPQMYQAYTPIQPQAQQTTQGGLIWVSGEAGAKAYLVAPNNTVQLWDSESQTIYLKSADASGMPSMKVLDYTIRETGKTAQNNPVNVPAENLSNFATKDEIRAVSDQIAALRKRVDKINRRQEDEDNE